MAQSESHRAIRKYLKTILLEAEFMKQYRPMIKDKNSISSILMVLRQQIEKKKMFVESNAQDFRYNFVINAIKMHFDVFKAQARQEFQNFVHEQLRDQIENN